MYTCIHLLSMIKQEMMFNVDRVGSNSGGERRVLIQLVGFHVVLQGLFALLNLTFVV